MPPGGPVEEIGKVAVTTVEALRSTPMILFVLVFNLAMMLFIGYLEFVNGERWERTVERAINYCIPASKGEIK